MTFPALILKPRLESNSYEPKRHSGIVKKDKNIAITFATPRILNIVTIDSDEKEKDKNI